MTSALYEAWAMTSDKWQKTELAYILHSRKYNDSDVILELFSATYGRVTAVVNTSKQSFRYEAYQPFCPYSIAWSGRSNFKKIRYIDALSQSIPLQAQAIFCGMYLNELLLRLLYEQEPQDALVFYYQQTLLDFASLDGLSLGELEPILRRFELYLLDELGYGLYLSDDEDGNVLDGNSSYQYVNQRGLVPLGSYLPDDKQLIFSGDVFKQIAARDFSDAKIKFAAKLLCRKALAALLGGKPIKARELFKYSGF
ncbi:MAG: DNA repair protein RecO [Alteromonadaceae bacterium]|nr:MAG: DNA repair protein RecO [Alteromonadaceae bacterium]